MVAVAVDMISSHLIVLSCRHRVFCAAREKRKVKLTPCVLPLLLRWGLMVARAWNYSYLGGADQAKMGVAFGARRQIIGPRPQGPGGR